MAQLLVRNLDDSVKHALSQRALAHGRSMEEEARNLLSAALIKPTTKRKPLGSRIAARFEGIGLTEPIAEVRGQLLTPIKF